MRAPGSVIVGIDIGTTNLKVVAARPGGHVEVVVRRSMVVDHPEPGASEFNLDALDANLVSALAELASALDAKGIAPGSIAGIGVASIGESFVGLDAEGRRLTPCPTWFDRRASNTRPGWGMDAARWFDITGMVDDDIYTVHRLAWWRNRDRAEWARVRTWLMVADYVTFRLAGRQVASPSLAARSGLADRQTGDWSQAILDAAGLDRGALPLLQPSASIAGGLTPEAARATGLLAGTPVVNAGHDHPCAGLGCGLVVPGRIMDSTGTSEALKTVAPRPLSHAEVGGGRYDCYPHVVPGHFLLSGHIPSSGGMIDWLLRFLSGPRPTPEIAALLWQSAEAAPPGSGGIRVSPFLAGTGAPWNDRERRADISFVDAQSSPGAVLRAGVEALAGWLSVNLSEFETITGCSPGTLTLTGGAAARNPLINAIKGAMIERNFTRPDVQEAAGLGAALVAGLAVEIFATGEEAARLPDVQWHDVPFDPALAATYGEIRPSIHAHLQGHASSCAARSLPERASIVRRAELRE
ncbi:gluconokinase/xylulokinase [Faunimonas pinastri]|uniref:Gluconokinase/xylulokinase n=1 Tax=Faunimonas pinastri TaxID=1855383 RepID=A0A1H9EHY3_9HYPH|nr:FGGY-family carbohydrate kinase [Faunimonas pinastri]SEQ25281.1 gluconokinase/xylulokinase [Faunimonas pinastri]